MSDKLNIYGRLSFEHVFRPDGSKGVTPAYSATILIPKDDPQIAKIREVIKQVAKDKWKNRADGILKNIYTREALCLRDGDMKADSSATYESYRGMMYVASRNTIRPTVVDRDPTREIVEADGKIYSGCYVNARIEFWAQDNDNGKRINGKLLGIQFVKDGDRFGGGSGPAKAEDFEVLGDEDGAEKNPWD